MALALPLSRETSTVSLQCLASATATRQQEQTPLEAVLAACHTCFLQPYVFFVSWQGVLTLAFTGFPPALVELKSNIYEACPELPPENPGSKWPKTTLGAVRDRKRLTPEQLTTLNAICKEESAAFTETDRVKDALRIWVDRVAVALYSCRSLQRLLISHEVLLDTTVDPRPVDPIEQERVQSIVEEAYGDDYWFAASRDGNRAEHYTGQCVGATLMHKLAAFNSTTDSLSAPLLPGIMKKFRDRVERELPDVYHFFPESSLHVTLRALT